MIFDTDRLKAAIGAVVRELFPNLRYFGCYAYRVESATGGMFSGRPERKSIGLPDLANVPIRGPATGGAGQVILAAGSSVGIMFLDGDPTRPVLAFADDASDNTESGLKATGRLHFVTGAHFEINGASDFVALAAKVLTELNAIKTAHDAHAHPTPWGPSGPPLAPMPAPHSVASSVTKTD